MDLAHEVMEVDAALAHERHAQVEGVHQEALAAPDRAPQVHALRQRRLDEKALQRRVALRLVGAPFLVQTLQPLDRAHLRGVRHEAAPLEVLLVELKDIHGQVSVLTMRIPAATARPPSACCRVIGSPIVAQPISTPNTGEVKTNTLTRLAE